LTEKEGWVPQNLTDKIKSQQASGYFKKDGTLIETPLRHDDVRRVVIGLVGDKISTKANSKTVIEEVFSDYLSTKNIDGTYSGHRVDFDEIVSADQTNIHFLKNRLFPSANSDRKKCDYGLRNNSYAPRIAELIRRTVKENK